MRVLVLSGIVLALAACSTPADDITSALDQSHTAVASVALAAELVDHGGLPTSSLVASTTDAMAELQDATKTLSELTDQATKRDAALAAIDEARDAVIAVQDALARGSTLDGARDALERADEGLTR